MSKGGLTIEIDTLLMRTIRKALPDKLNEILRQGGEQMVNEMKLSMGSSPPGETYVRGGVSHVASVPGEPPNPDSGSLLGSIRGNPSGHLRYRIEDGVEHGLYMEFGTETVEPRPWMNPIFNKWRDGLFTDLFRDNLL